MPCIKINKPLTYLVTLYNRGHNNVAYILQNLELYMLNDMKIFESFKYDRFAISKYF